ncbi:winged helix-turn-helix transcriptional regulator [Agaribacter marinus]|uniref:HTH hxlR-type domain-containing protein n=1 Tax=Agaribacter marinus TaxID=1431249 RepID=A0AA37T039_9ALTE|nr:helix-turn-helix domain-containing protein [Agaribacter marinus]GLR73093.1 hypothetical protein GCM10007852_40010 [Agaribacter marinus]
MSDLLKLVEGEFRSSCPLCCALDLLGDKWSLIILRDMLFFKKRQYQEFLESSEAISTNILSNRLKRLEELKLIDKRMYQTNPKRYEYKPTNAAEELRQPILVLMQWSLANVKGMRVSTEKIEQMVGGVAQRKANLNADK